MSRRDQVGLAWLGASNFARCLPLLAAGLAADRPQAPWISVCGHGRAYCGPSILGSRWLGREMPSIVDAWRTQADSSGLGFDVIAGDFGNDLAYGRSAREVIERAGELLRRPWRHRTVVEPPLESVAALPKAAFRVAAALLFPGRALHRDGVLMELGELHAGLRRLAHELEAAWIEVPAEWMAADGIHVRRGARRRFVRRVTATFMDGEGGSPAPATLWPPWWRRRPEREAIWWLGRRSEWRHASPEPSATTGGARAWVRFL